MNQSYPPPVDILCSKVGCLSTINLMKVLGRVLRHIALLRQPLVIYRKSEASQSSLRHEVLHSQMVGLWLFRLDSFLAPQIVWAVTRRGLVGSHSNNSDPSRLL